MTENGSYKRNLLLKRRKKLLHQIEVNPKS